MWPDSQSIDPIDYRYTSKRNALNENLSLFLLDDEDDLHEKEVQDGLLNQKH